MTDETTWLTLLTAFIVAILVAIVWSYLRSLRLSETVGETERGLVYRYGRFTQEVGPGRHWMLFGRSMVKVSTAERTFQVGNQEVLSADRLAVKVTALATYRIVHPRKSIEKSETGHFNPVYYAAQLALRDVFAELPVEDLIDARTKLDDRLTARAKDGFAEQGCELIRLALRDLVLPAEVRRLATDVTRAKLEAAASLERARGEQATLRLLSNAARLLKGNPELMNLRILQTLTPSPGKPAPTVILGGAPGVVPVANGAGGPTVASDPPEGG